MIDRRQFALGAGALLLPGCVQAKTARRFDAAAHFAEIERTAGGRLGAYLLDTGIGEGIGWRMDERFALCSTFKLSLAALALRETEAGRARADEILPYARTDLLPNSPETEKRLGEGGMSIVDLAEAGQRYSDNCAANLLLRRFGGPEALTRFWREVGDAQTRLDRYETELNRVAPGDPRDTTTPQAMARGVGRILTGGVLTPSGVTQLVRWMTLTATGAKRIRAGVPADWRGGDKTGTANAPGLATKINDVAVLYPAMGRPPLVVTAYYETAAPTETIRAEDEDVLRQVGEVAVKWVI